MKIQIKISADTQEEVNHQYVQMHTQLAAMGLHQLLYNAMVPLTIDLTYVSEDVWKEHQERLHQSCRNSMGSVIEKGAFPMINSILGMRDASTDRT